MKNGYYIHFDAKRTPGVAKKIDMQVNEFSRHYRMQEINIRALEVSCAERMCRLLPGKSIARTYKEALEQIDEPAFIYVRRTTADKSYRLFFREIKKRWPKCKAIVEIFTYPYDKDEFFRLMSWPYYFKEIHNRPKLVNYIDRYVTYSKDKEIFHIPTIQTGNGIAVDQVKMPDRDWQDNGEIHLIAVAFMQKHHGYERVIKGMRAYYSKHPNSRIILHLVGDGPEKKNYQKMTAKYGLEKEIIFYPTMVGEELDKVYAKADIAISALGVYKDGLNRENTLKTKEYMAKGFPMITGCQVDGIQEGYPFVYEFTNDATPIDMDRVVQFYMDLRQKYKKREMQYEIRNYVKKIADMSVVMQPIIEYIEKD